MITRERHFVKLGIHDNGFVTLSGGEAWFFQYPKLLVRHVIKTELVDSRKFLRNNSQGCK
jgi:hypothetical protein